MDRGREMDSLANEVGDPMESSMCVDVSMSDRGMTFLPVDIDMEPHLSDDNPNGDNLIEEELDSWEGGMVQDPYVGMEFKSEGDARSFYNAYARRVGFGTRVRYSHRSERDKQIVVQRYVCSKEGFRQNTEGVRKRDRAVTRVGCNASMTVRKVSPGKWMVKSFEREHNHPLVSPTQVQFLRSHRGKSNGVRNSSKSGNRLAMGATSDILNGFPIQQDWNMSGCLTEFECSCYLPSARQRELALGDTQSILEHLKHMQNANPSFFYAVQVDKEDHLTNFFWVDAASRLAYKYFGDVATFDTTYLTNKYRMPFAPFVGVNHHNQSVLFGCALLTDDTKATYVWLFKTWLKAMRGCQPVSVITDHDKSIQAAVAEVFPKTRHRFCMWHIQRKLLEKLGHVCRTHKHFKDEFHKCIYQTMTIEHFESNWGHLLTTFDLQGNEWLQLLYEDRHYWVPVFLKDTFFAEMSTTQRSYAFFDGYVNVHSGPGEFFRQYDTALDSRYYKEVRAEFDTMYTTPNWKTSSPMEKHAASLYTREIFKKFQVELFECFGYMSTKISDEEGGYETYLVAQFGEENTPHTVTFSETDIRGTCSCQKFEFAGILCRHLLSVFKMCNIFEIPSHFILKRWTRNAKSRDVLDDCSSELKGNGRQSMIMRFNHLCHQFMSFAEEGAKSIESYNLASRALQSALEEVAKDSVARSGRHSSQEQPDQGRRNSTDHKSGPDCNSYLLRSK